MEAPVGRRLEGVGQTGRWGSGSLQFQNVSPRTSAPAVLCSPGLRLRFPPESGSPLRQQGHAAAASSPAHGPGSRPHWRNGLFVSSALWSLLQAGFVSTTLAKLCIKVPSGPSR